MLYDAVIRSRGLTKELELTVHFLRQQSAPPQRVIVVDCVGDEVSRPELLKVCDLVVDYLETPFNYSRAINVGVAQTTAPMVLVLSSHTYLCDNEIVRNGFREMAEVGAGVVSWKAGPVYSLSRVDRTNFTGRNGLSNSCALIPRDKLVAVPFDERVFSAEDQHWSKQYVANGGVIARIEADRIVYANPHHHETSPNLQKLVNEEVAIAIFVNNEEMSFLNICIRYAKAAINGLGGDNFKRRLHIEVAYSLIKFRLSCFSSNSDYLNHL